MTRATIAAFALLYALLALAVWTMPVRADVMNGTSFRHTHDKITVEKEGVVYVLTYSNSANRNSPEGYHDWSAEGIEFQVHIDVGGFETLTVYAPPGYQAEPERIEVYDGDEGVVILSPLMF